MGIAALAVPAGALMALPMAAASAAPSNTVSATTHASDHPDTTSVETDFPSPGGDVWAYDNLSLQFSAALDPSGRNLYTVTITTHGSFAAVADPISGAPYTGTGSVDGTITYEVSSPTAPSAKNLPAQEPGSTLGGMVNQLFAGKATNIVTGSYSFTYNPIEGSTYTQA